MTKQLIQEEEAHPWQIQLVCTAPVESIPRLDPITTFKVIIL